jgi:hypothetical protein
MIDNPDPQRILACAAATAALTTQGVPVAASAVTAGVILVVERVQLDVVDRGLRVTVRFRRRERLAAGSGASR